MAVIKKKSDTYNVYNVELSFGQLETIIQALEQNHSDAISDELLAELQWYVDKLPGPGEEETEETEGEETAKPGDLPEPESELPPPPSEGAEESPINSSAEFEEKFGNSDMEAALGPAEPSTEDVSDMMLNTEEDLPEPPEE